MKANISILFPIMCALFMLSAGCRSETPQNAAPNAFPQAWAKNVIADKRLTDRAIDCLEIVTLERTEKYATIVNVHEIHNEKCKGDTSTSPRLFTIALDKNGNIWSDAKSLLGQLEKLE